MNDHTQKAVNRLLDRLERNSQRTRHGFSRAPIYLVLGLIVAYQLLVRFVPMVWASMLPHGLEQAGHLAGAPGMLWRASLACNSHFGQVVVLIAGISLAGLVFSRGPWPFRLLVWLAAVGAVVLDVFILFITMKASLGAVLEGSGLP